MSKEKAICILLIFVIVFMFFGWNNSEHNRLALLEELRSNESEYEERIEELKREIEFWKEEAGY